jgi:hypothetical protein
VTCSRTGLIANARCCSGTSFFLLATAVQRAGGAAAAWGGRLADLGCDPAGESRSWTYGPRQVATTWYIDEENALPRRTNQPVAQLAKLAERGDLASCVQGGEERHRWHLWCSTIALCGVCMLLVNTLSLQRAVLRPLFPLLTTDATFSITSIIPPDALQPAS